jgi:hypothetical protein
MANDSTPALRRRIRLPEFANLAPDSLPRPHGAAPHGRSGHWPYWHLAPEALASAWLRSSSRWRIFSLIACVWGVYRRAHGTIAIFWFLFVLVLVFWLVPTALHAYDTLFNKTTLSDSTWRLLFCLYGAPILMMLFLPSISGRTRPSSRPSSISFKLRSSSVSLIRPSSSFPRNTCCPTMRCCITSASVTCRVCFYWLRFWSVCLLRKRAPREVCCSGWHFFYCSARSQPSSAIGSTCMVI